MTAQKPHPAPNPLLPSGPADAPAPSKKSLEPALGCELEAFVAAQRAPGTRSKYEEYIRDFLGWADIQGS
jgi:hypothetical protein